jgi:hypothetical protein
VEQRSAEVSVSWSKSYMVQEDRGEIIGRGKIIYEMVIMQIS